MRPPRRLLVPAAALAASAALAVLVVGCGGGSSSGGSGGTDGSIHNESVPEPKSDDANRFPRGPSVDYFDPAPPIAASVRKAAKAAGCTTRGFDMEPVQVQPDGTLHVEGNPTYKVSLPPTSGLHYPVWADWGIYSVPLPFRYQVHNLEHGGIIVHLGTAVPRAARSAINRLWADSPAYMLITPETFAQFPKTAVVVTSWQRWMVCKPWTAKAINAIRVYRNVYRGTGPEQVGAVNSPEPPPGAPEPTTPDPGAAAG
jgi:hypothetical protein